MKENKMPNIYVSNLEATLSRLDINYRKFEFLRENHLIWKRFRRSKKTFDNLFLLYTCTTCRFYFYQYIHMFYGQDIFFFSVILLGFLFFSISIASCKPCFKSSYKFSILYFTPLFIYPAHLFT